MGSSSQDCYGIIPLCESTHGLYLMYKIYIKNLSHLVKCPSVTHSNLKYDNLVSS